MIINYWEIFFMINNKKCLNNIKKIDSHEKSNTLNGYLKT
jgi:hypothetical protein